VDPKPRTNLSELKARIDILEVLEKIGAMSKIPESWDDEVAVWCPFCDDKDSRKPAARANPVKGLYFCYKCSFGGSIIDIAQRHLQDQAQKTPTYDPDAHIWGSYTDASIGRAVEWLESNWPPPKEEEDDPWA
jgi:hypothetical protein